MKIFTNFNTNNISFNGSHAKLSNEELTKILEPLFEQKEAYKVIMYTTGLSHNIINKWAKETKGMTANKLYHQYRTKSEPSPDNKIKDKLEALKNEGFTYNDICKFFGRSKGWVSHNFRKYNLSHQPTYLQLKMQENVPRMIEEGYTLKEMGEKLGCGYTCVSNWIVNTYKKSILQLKREMNPEGKLTELQKKMQENIPRMINEGYTLEAMAKELGCGHTYVSRWILDTYKKSIVRIRHEKDVRINIHA